MDNPYRIFEEKDGKFGGDAEFVYSNPSAIFYNLVDPKDLNVIGGRAYGKTTNVISGRMLRVNKAMPGCYTAFVGDFYSNLLSNTVPTMINGWEKLGMVEGKHFVLNDRPPSHFERPYKKPISYKHTISFFNGCFYKLASMDIVSSVAGDSYQHVTGDEVKYLNKSKMDKLLPAKRGERMRFGGSTYYLGTTFTTDMPNTLAPNEYDWILDTEANMDLEQIKFILYCALEVNKIKIALKEAHIKNNRSEFEKQKRLFYRWNQRLYKVRYNSTLFHIISSFGNVDILTLDWFRDQLEGSGIEAFKTSILSMKQELKDGEKFYPAFENRHLYEGGVVENFYDTASFGDLVKLNSLGLIYCVRTQALEAGFDMGKMASLVIGQKQGWSQRIFKNMYALGKFNIENLAQDFVEFFQHHSRKHLKLYHDRGTNQNKSMGYDFATRLKNAIESAEINGVRQNWKVELMNEGQGTIYQYEDFNVCNTIFAETNPRLPKILIDGLQCKELVSSLGLAKLIMKPNRHGVNQVHKDKTSEKLPLNRLPMSSTNFSDAFKYYFCRPEYMREVSNDGSTTSSFAPVVHRM